MLLSIPLYLWLDIRGKVQLWFATPQLILLPLGTLFLATYLPSFQRSRRQMVRWITACLMSVYLVAISPVGAALAMGGLKLFLPTDDGQPADAVVVLGRGSFQAVERTEKAARLWYEQRAPMILASGAADAPKFVDWLAADGIPDDALLQEPCSNTTEENAVLSALILKEKQVRRILLVTDMPHILRSLLTFRSFGFEVVPKPLPLPDRPFTIDASIAALREYVGIAIYAFSGRFSDRSDVSASPKTQRVQERLAYCIKQHSIAKSSF